MFHSGAKDIKPGNAVNFVFTELSGFFFLLFLNIPDAPYQLPLFAVCVIYRVSCKGDPPEIRILGPFQTELHKQLIILPPQSCHNLPAVCLTNTLRVKKAVPIFPALPLAAHRFMVYNIQHMAFQVIGKEDIVGRLQGDPVPFFFFQ